MENISDVLTSPAWWITVVLAGICINIISAYLKLSLDVPLSSLSSWWRNRSLKRKEDFEDYVHILTEHLHEQIVACYNSLCRYFFAVIYLFFGIAMMALIQLLKVNSAPQALQIILLFCVATALFRAFNHLFLAVKIGEAVCESRERRRLTEQSTVVASGQVTTPQP